MMFVDLFIRRGLKKKKKSQNNIIDLKSEINIYAFWKIISVRGKIGFQNASIDFLHFQTKFDISINPYFEVRLVLVAEWRKTEDAPIRKFISALFFFGCIRNWNTTNT